MTMPRLIRPTDAAPYLAALVTIGLLAILATYGLRQLADRWPVPAAATPPGEAATARDTTAAPPRDMAASATRERAASSSGEKAAPDPGAGSAPSPLSWLSWIKGETKAGGARGTSPPAAVEELRARHLTLPVANVTADKLVPTFDEARGNRIHEALDIMAPRGTEVRAVEDGRIARLFWSDAGGHTIYQFDSSERFAYYYAHLDAYAAGLAEGQSVRRGQVIGQVGSTGNAREDAPHLHFAIFQLTPEKRWWDGEAIDPYPILRWQIDEGTR